MISIDMVIILIIFLFIACTFLFLMNRQEKIREYQQKRPSRKLSDKYEYLKRVREDTKRRLDFEKDQQHYTSSDKKVGCKF